MDSEPVGGIMRRYTFLILLFLGFVVVLQAEPYKPYPIIFVHGLGSSSGAWGAPTINRSDSIPQSSIESGHTYDHFLDYMHPYVWMLDTLGYDTTYTIPGGIPGWPKDPAYPNKTFLEVVNMDDPWGSIDNNYITRGGYESYHYTSWQDELWHRIKEVLKEYFGDGWESNPKAKVIIICHSAGAPATREMFRVHPDIVDHVHQLITADGVNEGSWLATPVWQAPEEFYNTREWVFLCFTNVPLWKWRWAPATCEAMAAILEGELDLTNIIRGGAGTGATFLTFSQFAEILAALELAALPWDEQWKGILAATGYGVLMKEYKPIIY